MIFSPTMIPGYALNDYKLIITPHEDLSEKIKAIQKSFMDKYEIAYKNAYLPQLILATFKQYSMAEERIINRLRLVGMAFHPIQVELKGYGSFPSHTIYINVEGRGGVIELVKNIRQESQRLMKVDKDNKPHFINDAHLTIARKLKPWQYEEGWKEYSHRHFSGKFISNKMLMMRKKTGEMKYSVRGSFDFQNMPIETIQGQLF